MNINRKVLAIYSSARSSLKNNPDPRDMSELDRVNVNTALTTPDAALLLMALRDYTSEGWWNFAELTTDDTASEVARVWAIIAACYSDGIEPEDALAAEHDLIVQLSQRDDPHDENPAVQYSPMLRDVLFHPDQVTVAKLFSLTVTSLFMKAGDMLVDEGIITEDERLTYELDAALSDGDLDGDIAEAASTPSLFGGSADGDGNGAVDTHSLEIRGSTYMDPMELEAHRYIYQCAYDTLSNIIATVTFNPGALHDFDTEFEELGRDFSCSELAFIAVFNELHPGLKILVELSKHVDPASLAHTSICAAIHIAYMYDYEHVFDEDCNPVHFADKREEQEFAAATTLADQVDSVNDNAETSGITSFVEHRMITEVLHQMCATLPEDDKRHITAKATFGLLSNPFNATKCSRLALWEIFTTPSDTIDPESNLSESLGLVSQIIAHRNDDLAYELDILDPEDEPGDSGFA